METRRSSNANARTRGNRATKSAASEAASATRRGANTTSKTTERSRVAGKSTARARTASKTTEQSRVAGKTSDRSRVTRKTTSMPRKDVSAPERLTPEQRAAAGRAAREQAPLQAHAEFEPQESREPVALLLSQAKTRVPDLVPIRHGRMLVSPFTFYRGAALIMAADLESTPASGLTNPTVR